MAAMSPREVVCRTVRLQSPDRLPRDFPGEFGCDFAWAGMNPSPDARPSSGTDEWRAVWHNIGVSHLGEVKDFPLKDWSEFENLTIPDIRDRKRWESLEGARDRAGEQFLFGAGLSVYERVHFIRGLRNTWTDMYTNPDDLRKLLSILVDMNLVAIERYAAAGCDGLIFCDDWGLQDRLMIRPDSWRELWKPCYAAIYSAAHDAGLLTFLHSCGYIVDILDDLIEAGLDVIQMDQQTMCRGSLDDIRAYARELVAKLGTKEGGFIPKWYGDPKGAGHTQEAVDAMCSEFLQVSDEMYGR